MKWPSVKTGENIFVNKDLCSFFNGDSSYNASYSFRATGHFIRYTCAGVHESNSNAFKYIEMVKTTCWSSENGGRKVI